MQEEIPKADTEVAVQEHHSSLCGLQLQEASHSVTRPKQCCFFFAPFPSYSISAFCLFPACGSYRNTWQLRCGYLCSLPTGRRKHSAVTAVGVVAVMAYSWERHCWDTGTAKELRAGLPSTSSCAGLGLTRTCSHTPMPLSVSACSHSGAGCQQVLGMLRASLPPISATDAVSSCSVFSPCSGGAHSPELRCFFPIFQVAG